jgi:two-component system chemotaxis response regulator CheB
MEVMQSAASTGRGKPRPLSSPRLVVLAASAGGLAPVCKVLEDLPADFPAAIALVMHRSTEFPDQLIRVLQRRTRLAVKSAQDGSLLQAGVVYVCPPGFHMATEHCLRLIEGPRLRFVLPSADLMFESMARCYGERSIAVVLSGANADGALGSLAIAGAGGSVIAQEPESCQFADMPTAALKIGATAIRLPPERIATALQELVCHECPAPPRTTASGITRVMLADDHQMMLNGLHVLLDGEQDMTVVGQAADGQAALSRFAELAPDVVVMDISMPHLDGVETTREMIARTPSTKVVALSAHSDIGTVNRIVAAGATGYLTKNRAYGELAQAIRSVEQSRAYFSDDVARLVDLRRVRVPPMHIR